MTKGAIKYNQNTWESVPNILWSLKFMDIVCVDLKLESGLRKSVPLRKENYNTRNKDDYQYRSKFLNHTSVCHHFFLWQKYPVDAGRILPWREKFESIKNCTEKKRESYFFTHLRNISRSKVHKVHPITNFCWHCPQELLLWWYMSANQADRFLNFHSAHLDLNSSQRHILKLL